MDDKQLQKIINDFGTLLGGNVILLQAYKTIIDEFQNRLNGGGLKSNENPSDV